MFFNQHRVDIIVKNNDLLFNNQINDYNTVKKKSLVLCSFNLCKGVIGNYNHDAFLEYIFFKLSL